MKYFLAFVSCICFMKVVSLSGKKKLLILGGNGVVGKFALNQSLVYLEKGIYSQITIAGRNYYEGLELLKEISLNNRKCRNVKFEKIDVYEDHFGLVGLMKEHDIVISCIGPFFQFGPLVARAAVEAGVPLFDINDDKEPIKFYLKHLDSYAKEQNMGLYIGYGFSPGLTSFLAKYGFDQLDSDQTITVEINLGFSVTDQSAGQASLIHSFHMFADIADIFSTLRQFLVEFESPTGIIEVTEISSSDFPPISMFQRENKNVKSASFRLGFIPSYISDFLAAISQLGLIGGPWRDKIIANLFRFLSRFIFSKSSDFVEGSVFRVDIYGTKNGENAHLSYSSARPIPVGKISGCVVAVSAMLFATNLVEMSSGFLPPESQKNPKLFLEILEEEIDGLSIIYNDGDFISDNMSSEYPVDEIKREGSTMWSRKNFFLLIVWGSPIIICVSIALFGIIARFFDKDE